MQVCRDERSEDRWQAKTNRSFVERRGETVANWEISQFILPSFFLFFLSINCLAEGNPTKSMLLKSIKLESNKK